MIFRFRRREKAIEKKETLIRNERDKLHSSINKDLKQIEKVNKALADGITLKIYKAMKHGH